MRFRIAHHLVDLFFAETRRCSDGDLLLAACTHVLRRDVHDTVGIDVKCNFDLRHPARRRRHPDQMELAKRAIIGRHGTFTLQHVNFHRRLIVRSRRENLGLARRNRRVAFN